MRLFPWAWSPDWRTLSTSTSGQSYSHRSAGQTSLCGWDPLSAGDRLGFPQRGGPRTPKSPEVLVGRKLAKLGRPALSRGELEGLGGWESEFTGMAFPRGGESSITGAFRQRLSAIAESRAGDQGETTNLSC